MCPFLPNLGMIKGKDVLSFLRKLDMEGRESNELVWE